MELICREFFGNRGSEHFYAYVRALSSLSEDLETEEAMKTWIQTYCKSAYSERYCYLLDLSLVTR